MLRLGLDQPVLLIGAGICGLAIAHGLQEANIPFCIFDTEDDSTAQSTDWQIACHSGMPMLKKLLSENIADRLDVDAIVDPTLDCNRYTGCAFERSGGELVGEVAADGECLRISRAKFRSMCCEGVDIEVSDSCEPTPRKVLT
jgi:UDP-N-acetylmuramoylalanine-D-glutamate ligase